MRRLREGSKSNVAPAHPTAAELKDIVIIINSSTMRFIFKNRAVYSRHGFQVRRMSPYVTWMQILIYYFI